MACRKCVLNTYIMQMKTTTDTLQIRRVNGIKHTHFKWYKHKQIQHSMETKTR